MLPMADNTKYGANSYKNTNGNVFVIGHGADCMTVSNNVFAVLCSLSDSEPKTDMGASLISLFVLVLCFNMRSAQSSSLHTNNWAVLVCTSRFW